MAQWCVLNKQSGIAEPVSSTERGAKQWATKHGFSSVCRMNNYNWETQNFQTFSHFQTKQNGKWIPG